MVNGEKNESRTMTLDLDLTMLNVELVRAISICYIMFKFQVD